MLYEVITIGREAFAAVDALASSADGAAIFRRARIDNFALNAGAISAFHDGMLLIWCIVTYYTTIFIVVMPQLKFFFSDFSC